MKLPICGINIAFARRVDSKEKFTLAMNWLVREDEKRQREEARKFARGERRARIFGHVRGIFVLLLLVAIGLFVNNYWGQFAKSNDPSSSAKTKGKASVALQGARQAAADRDSLIDDVTQ